MSHIHHKTSHSNNLNQHLPTVQNHLESQVRRILQQLSIKKENQLKSSLNPMSNNIFALKLSKYDYQAKQKSKFQLRNQMSPPKWKVSTNMNSEFSHNERVKGKILTGWDMQRTNLSKRSYEQPKQYHGVKFDLFSRQFPNDLSKTHSKGFNKKLKQIQSEYQKKVFEGNIKTIKQKRQRQIDAIRSRGSKFQMSKDKLFGFTTPIKSSPIKLNQFRNTISHFSSNTSKSTKID